MKKSKLNLVHKLSTDIVFQFENEPSEKEKAFKPDFSPIEMFYLGIFEGHYFKINSLHKCKFLQMFLDDIKKEREKDFDSNLFFRQKNHLQNENPSTDNNLFEVVCGSTHQQWIDKNWIIGDDPNGWVEWYIKFYYGRRTEYDLKQIGRWLSFKGRHAGMLLKWAKPHELDKCCKTRQNLLHWAIDSTKI